MTTRFYLESTGAVGITPTAAASWEDTSAFSRYPAKTPKDSSTLTTVGFTDADATNKDCLLGQWISAALGAQTISGTWKFQMRFGESSASNQMFPSMVVRIIGSDGSTVRGTSVAAVRGGAEMVGSSTLRNLSMSGSLTNVNALDGDFAVIEVGGGGDPAAGFSHTFEMRIGSASGSDLPEDNTTTTDNNPWFEFSGDLSFSSGAVAVETLAALGVG